MRAVRLSIVSALALALGLACLCLELRAQAQSLSVWENNPFCLGHANIVASPANGVCTRVDSMIEPTGGGLGDVGVLVTCSSGGAYVLQLFKTLACQNPYATVSYAPGDGSCHTPNADGYLSMHVNCGTIGGANDAAPGSGSESDSPTGPVPLLVVLIGGGICVCACLTYGVRRCCCSSERRATPRSLDVAMPVYAHQVNLASTHPQALANGGAQRTP